MDALAQIALLASQMYLHLYLCQEKALEVG